VSVHERAAPESLPFLAVALAVGCFRAANEPRSASFTTGVSLPVSAPPARPRRTRLGDAALRLPWQRRRSPRLWNGAVTWVSWRGRRAYNCGQPRRQVLAADCAQDRGRVTGALTARLTTAPLYSPRAAQATPCRVSRNQLLT
jgi:hypothetical protein